MDSVILRPSNGGWQNYVWNPGLTVGRYISCSTLSHNNWRRTVSLQDKFKLQCLILAIFPLNLQMFWHRWVFLACFSLYIRLRLFLQTMLFWKSSCLTFLITSKVSYFVRYHNSSWTVIDHGAELPRISDMKVVSSNNGMTKRFLKMVKKTSWGKQLTKNQQF